MEEGILLLLFDKHKRINIMGIVKDKGSLGGEMNRPYGPTNGSTELRSTQLKNLIRARRMLALSLRCDNNESDRAQLEKIDLELAQNKTDILDVLQRVAMSRDGKRNLLRG